MEYNEKLMNEALQGSKSSLKELKSNAGSGSAEAQYYLALYYSKGEKGELDPNCQYWIEKAIDNGYVPGNGVAMTQEQIDALEDMKPGSIVEGGWWFLRIFGRLF